MMYLIFMVLDVFTAFVLVAAQFSFDVRFVFFYHALYLLAKGIWYIKSWMSWIDIFFGLYLLTMIFGLRGWFAYVGAAWFLYKAIIFFAYR